MAVSVLFLAVPWVHLWYANMPFPGPVVIKLKLSTKFILLINVKMPTTVGIFTFISMINTTSERLKASNFFIMLVF